MQDVTQPSRLFPSSGSAQGTSTNYVEKTRLVGGSGNVNRKQIFPYFTKDGFKYDNSLSQ